MIEDIEVEDSERSERSINSAVEEDQASLDNPQEEQEEGEDNDNEEDKEDLSYLKEMVSILTPEEKLYLMKCLKEKGKEERPKKARSAMTYNAKDFED